MWYVLYIKSNGITHFKMIEIGFEGLNLTFGLPTHDGKGYRILNWIFTLPKPPGKKFTGKINNEGVEVAPLEAGARTCFWLNPHDPIHWAKPKCPRPNIHATKCTCILQPCLIITISNRQCQNLPSPQIRHFCHLYKGAFRDPFKPTWVSENISISVLYTCSLSLRNASSWSRGG